MRAVQHGAALSSVAPMALCSSWTFAVTGWQEGVVVATAGEELADQQRARAALVDAGHAVDRTRQALGSRPMHPDELREAVTGAVTVVEVLITVVGHLMLPAPWGVGRTRRGDRGGGR